MGILKENADAESPNAVKTSGYVSFCFRDAPLDFQGAVRVRKLGSVVIIFHTRLGGEFYVLCAFGDIFFSKHAKFLNLRIWRVYIIFSFPWGRFIF